MRSAALLALLPVLAAAAVLPDAHAPLRKSVSYGPAHKHSTWELHPEHSASLSSESNPLKIAAGFISEKLGTAEGEGFYIRDDVSVICHPSNQCPALSHARFECHPSLSAIRIARERSTQRCGRLARLRLAVSPQRPAGAFMPHSTVWGTTSRDHA